MGLAASMPKWFRPGLEVVDVRRRPLARSSSALARIVKAVKPSPSARKFQRQRSGLRFSRPSTRA